MITPVCESIVIPLPSLVINHILLGYPELTVVGSRFLEDGIELLIEGPADALSECLTELNERIADHRTVLEQDITVLQQLEDLPF